jgi:hypothetical protein
MNISMPCQNPGNTMEMFLICGQKSTHEQGTQDCTPALHSILWACGPKKLGLAKHEQNEVVFAKSGRYIDMFCSRDGVEKRIYSKGTFTAPQMYL